MPKKPVSLTVEEEILPAIEERWKALSYRSLSEYAETLFRADLAERAAHSIVREEGDVRYQTRRAGKKALERQ